MIEKKKKSYSKKQIYKVLHPWVQKWFDSKFDDFTPAQKKSIVDIHKKNNILISSPTGSGKTLTAFLSIISELTALAEEDKLEECKKLLADMSKEELRTIMHSKWMDKGNALYPTLFELFFKDELKNVVIKLNEMKTLDLIQELKETKSSYKKEKIPEILLNRYESMDDVERKDVFKILLRKGLVDKDNNKQIEELKDL